ncbi:MAG: exodeoxyribonuclease VII small subunit [Clostridia bacterium]|nr:exodeoxyribonuclease VII small subunit [Clostridia bacterium]
MAKKVTFEESMAELEAIVRELESGDIPLERSMKLFEEGTKLSAALSRQLDTAEQKVTLLLQKQDGEVAEQPFEEDAT